MFRSKNKLNHLKNAFSGCDDLVIRSFPELEIVTLYFGHLVGNEELEQNIIHPFSHISENEVRAVLESSPYEKCESEEKLIEGILAGKAAIFYQETATYLIDLFAPEIRSITAAEIETVIVGPREAFVESVQVNLSLIRRRLQTNKLKVLSFKIGDLTNTQLNVLYLEGKTSYSYVESIKTRLQKVKVEGIHDLNMMLEYIEEYPFSLFPQYLTTERPDVVVSKLLEGKVVGLCDGSPYAFSAPTSFWEYFQSPDDYNQRWILGSLSRILRLIALFIILFFTAFYVSLTMFHYEMIPVALLKSLIESRSKVPFPPVFEALIMEFIVELLREAGARLPDKIGQTIGIVGGIVIGTASVEAGFTSNILIVVVAVSAIASFVIPHIIMSASIRVSRFLLIILAGTLGNFGFVAGFTFIVIYLARLTSLERSYLVPLAPISFSKWRDTFIRVPLINKQDK
ncbi:spore germination protein [Halalkalibacter oceani]|uniref:spore germination protein n=1 Tax=Halalkalibacter oceani TaxID=1653776 RepID=UPI00339507EE